MSVSRIFTEITGHSSGGQTIARRKSPPIDADEVGKYIPKLDIHLPELIADETDRVPDAFDFPVGEYPIPDREDQDLEPVE